VTPPRHVRGAPVAGFHVFESRRSPTRANTGAHTGDRGPSHRSASRVSEELRSSRLNPAPGGLAGHHSCVYLGRRVARPRAPGRVPRTITSSRTRASRGRLARRAAPLWSPHARTPPAPPWARSRPRGRSALLLRPSSCSVERAAATSMSSRLHDHMRAPGPACGGRGGGAAATYNTTSLVPGKWNHLS